MHRFYVPSGASQGETVEFSAAQSRQIATVLRLRAGATVEVFDGQGSCWLAKLTIVRPERTVGDLREARTEPWPFPWRVTVYLALIRPQRFEWAIEKASELGAAAVVPTLTEHCTHGDGTLSPGRLARWQQIAIEAAEQCGSAFVPEIRPVARFSDTLEAPAGLRLFAWEGADDAVRQPLLDLLPALSRVAAAPPELALFVGPEGGFSPREVQAARDGGCSVVSLGPLTLRAETAAVGALAILAQVRVEFPS